jgi:hypothetical protein
MRFKRKIKEEAPTNSVGSGAIAGVGVGPAGEPGVRKTKYKKNNEQEANALDKKINEKSKEPILKEDTFANHKTFIVPESLIEEIRQAKKDEDYSWDKYSNLNENYHIKAIREFAINDTQSPVIMQGEQTGKICYARYGSN